VPQRVRRDLLVEPRPPRQTANDTGGARRGGRGVGCRRGSERSVRWCVRRRTDPERVRFVGRGDGGGLVAFVVHEQGAVRLTSIFAISAFSASEIRSPFKANSDAKAWSRPPDGPTWTKKARVRCGPTRGWTIRSPASGDGHERLGCRRAHR